MGKAAVKDAADELIQAGLNRNTPALVVENASLPNERKVRTRLDLLAIATSATVTDGPAVLIIGEAVRPLQPSLPTALGIAKTVAVR